VNLECPWCQAANTDNTYCHSDGMWRCERCRWPVYLAAWDSLPEALAQHRRLAAERSRQQAKPAVEVAPAIDPRWFRPKPPKKQKKKRPAPVVVNDFPSWPEIKPAPPAESESHGCFEDEPWLFETHRAPERPVRLYRPALGPYNRDVRTNIIGGDDGQMYWAPLSPDFADAVGAHPSHRTRARHYVR
jgi:hypothetical protein